jgi:acetolactate synthase I/II/III large subunit
MTDKTVAEELIIWLRDHGVKHLFGVPSGSWLPYMEAMRKHGVEFVLVSNEASAGIMATVYAWLTGNPGACYATIGPGATNLSTGIGAAFLNRAPVFAFTSESPEPMMGRTLQMAIDQQTLFKPITKETFRLEVGAVNETMEKAFAIATSIKTGPVHIGLPEDLGYKTPGNYSQKASIPISAKPVPVPGKEALEAMIKEVKNSQYPVLAVGLGVVRARLEEVIRKIAKYHQIPVVLTPMAKGVVPEDHPSFAGVLFHALSDHVAETHKQADLVIAVGYDPIEFNFESWMPNVKLINIDTMQADIDKAEYPEVLNVTGKIEPALNALMDIKAIDSKWDFHALAERKANMFSHFVPEPSVFGPVAVLTALRNKLPEDGIMTCDVGSHTHLIGQMWRTPEPLKQIMDNGWSTMGFGVPSAIGAKISQPDKEVVCVTGDGGFLMMAGEMATAHRLGKRIVFILLSDRSLELINLKQKSKGLPSYGTALFGKDKPPVYADSIFDVPVIQASDMKSFEKALDTAFSSDGPTIVQAIIDPSDYGNLILKKHK